MNNSQKKIVTFGEIMVRLSPPAYQRIAFTRNFEVCYAGGEANVAVSLANYGMKSYFVSKIPTHEVGSAVIRTLQEMKVSTDYIIRGGDRLGVYYLEHGASIRPSKVIYDRTHSSISEATESEFNFETIFEGATWFHVSGISPALSESCAKLSTKALQCAKKMGITTSFDLNYRKKLWTPEEAQKTCIPLMEYVDVCIGNEEDAEKVLGFVSTGSDIQKGNLNIDGYKTMFEKLKTHFGFQYVATTLRESISASDNGWSALLYNGQQFFQSKKYNLHIVDRVGAGDSFSAGLIYALIVKKDLQHAINFAVAASALKHSIHGDFNQVSIEEVEKLATGDGSGRVER